ncbi:DUF2007 domain-containing protein [Aquimarina sp. ERC-38]|uniref:putative signal transducing protein n=1 Tax=Aquimarina sp. ERC-38 TaxID=2949996 RepID=UPI0022455B16|nr:DUF2007 domain-containing protein [Aquimarina sp. ERC-38]UZO79884.1 DUF2007 domain-containing protein [Aquimarina sp. ERC-38]
MFSESEYERVYTGGIATIKMLQSVLEDRGIATITRDDMKSGLMAGFGGGIPDHIQLFVKKTDLSTAVPIIEKSIA